MYSKLLLTQLMIIYLLGNNKLPKFRTYFLIMLLSFVSTIVIPTRLNFFDIILVLH